MGDGVSTQLIQTNIQTQSEEGFQNVGGIQFRRTKFSVIMNQGIKIGKQN